MPAKPPATRKSGYPPGRTAVENRLGRTHSSDLAAGSVSGSERVSSLLTVVALGPSCGAQSGPRARTRASRPPPWVGPKSFCLRGTVLTLALVAALAGDLPALRASRTDPAAVLRST
jgi:hypothetical protein